MDRFETSVSQALDNDKNSRARREGGRKGGGRKGAGEKLYEFRFIK